MCFDWFRKKKPIPPDLPPSLYPDETLEIPSPRNVVMLGDISLNIQGADVQLAEVADTNSMDPLFDIGHNAILAPFTEHFPYRKEDLSIGDIVVYQVGTRMIVHRITEITTDEYGRLYTIQGDNTAHRDPYLIRNQQLKYLMIGVIY